MRKYGLYFAGIGVLILSLAWVPRLLAVQEHTDERIGHETKSMEEADDNIVLDPVCGMKVKPEDAAGKSEYQGKTYYFCMDGEKEVFEKDPQKYLAALAEKQTPPESGMEPTGSGMGHREKPDLPHKGVEGSLWMAPEDASRLANPVKPTEESIVRGRVLFREKCMICHGESATGDGVLAETFSPRPADLAAGGIGQRPEGELFYKISKGRGVMPAWEVMLSGEDRWNLINYIGSLNKAGEATEGSSEK